METLHIRSTDGNVLFSHTMTNNTMRRTIIRAVMCKVNLADADLGGLDLSDLCFNEMNLSGTSFRYSDIQYSSFDHANLTGTDFSFARLGGAALPYAKLGGAKWKGATYFEAKISKGLVFLEGYYWDVYLMDDHIKIGCKMHTIEEWEKFTNGQIRRMDTSASEFWRKNKASIIAAARKHQQQSE